MILKLLCSTCSNPSSPEFRNFVMIDNKLTCCVCGRTLEIRKPKDYTEENFYGQLIKRNRIDGEDYVLQTTVQGQA